MKKIDNTRPDINVLFDYVTVTFPVDENEEFYREDRGLELHALFANSHFKFFMNLLNLDPRIYTECGKIEHYANLITYREHINVKFNGPLNTRDINTHALELKGEGCREVERLGINWYIFFAYIHEHDLNVSTLHLASDIFTDKYFRIEQLLKKALSEEYIASTRNFSYIESKKSDVKSGTSLYFGRRDDNQVNIYDKKNERYYKGFDVDTNTWIRIELRLKTSKSWDFIRLLVSKGIDKLPELYFQVLSSMLEFKRRSSTTDRKERWKIWQPWKHYLGTSTKIKLQNQARLESTLVKKRDWLLDSAGKTILEYFSAIDTSEKEKFLNELIKKKLEKIDNKSLVRVNEYRKTNNLPEFDSLDQYKGHIKSKLYSLI